MRYIWRGTKSSFNFFSFKDILNTVLIYTQISVVEIYNLGPFVFFPIFRSSKQLSIIGNLKTSKNHWSNACRELGKHIWNSEDIVKNRRKFLIPALLPTYTFFTGRGCTFWASISSSIEFPLNNIKQKFGSEGKS